MASRTGVQLPSPPISKAAQKWRKSPCLSGFQGDGATLREAVSFFLANRKTIKPLERKTFSECATLFVAAQRADNVSAIHITTLEKHYRRFNKTFGGRIINEITTLEIQAEMDAIDSQVEEIARSLGFGSGSSAPAASAKLDGRRGKRKRKHTMSAEGRARIAAAQKARWAKAKAAK